MFLLQDGNTVAFERESSNAAEIKVADSTITTAALEIKSADTAVATAATDIKTIESAVPKIHSENKASDQKVVEASSEIKAAGEAVAAAASEIHTAADLSLTSNVLTAGVPSDTLSTHPTLPTEISTTSTASELFALDGSTYASANTTATSDVYGTDFNDSVATTSLLGGGTDGDEDEEYEDEEEGEPLFSKRATLFYVDDEGVQTVSVCRICEYYVK